MTMAFAAHGKRTSRAINLDSLAVVIEVGFLGYLNWHQEGVGGTC